MYVHTYEFYRPQFYVLNLHFVFSWSFCTRSHHNNVIVHIYYVHDLFPLVYIQCAFQLNSHWDPNYVEEVMTFERPHLTCALRL